VEKKKVQGVFGQTTIFFLPLDLEQRGEPQAAALRWPSGHGRGRREGEKKEGDEGVLLPSSPWAGVRYRGGSMGGCGLQAAVVGDGTSGGIGELGRERELVVEVRGVEGGTGIVFIGAERRWSGRAKHTILVRPAARSVWLCRRRDVSGSGKFMAVTTRWCCGQDPSGKSGGERAGRCGGLRWWFDGRWC
jgi:hypothetical protein